MATTSDRFWLGTRKGAFEVARNGDGWGFSAPHMPGQPIPYAVEDARDGSVWASIDHGHWGVKLSRRRAGGAFEEVEAPKYPEATEKTARYYWVLAPGHADQPGTFHVGTEPGALFTTTDDGQSWQMNEPLWALRVEHEWQGGGRDAAGIHSICVDPTNASRMHVGVSCASVIETTDGGGSWAYRSKGMRMVFAPPDQQEMDHGYDPHFVVQSPSDPNVLWQSNHCGVYVTKDGGQQWADVSNKPLVEFGFPVAVHPTQPDTAWIVPMDSDERRTTVEGALRVMRTDDAGASWTEQTGGLPQENAWDFPFRHALDVGPTGDTLAFGTTSGNLYVSEDGGGSFACIASNLPPIYSLRFA